MEKVIEATLKLIPISIWFEKLGLSKKISAGLSVVCAAILLGLLTHFIKKSFVWIRKTKQEKKKNNPYFNYETVKKAKKLFVESRFQSLSPTMEDEPIISTSHIPSEKLIPFFIKKAFDEKKESHKFYLILGDSGMGKTTFMINLYYRYYSIFNWGRKYAMRVYPMGKENLLDQIQAISLEEKRNTILLLDAFDEDPYLVKSEETSTLTNDARFRKRLDQVANAAQEFKDVVITSRTQYFPGQEKEDYVLSIPRFDDEGYHVLQKNYISAFNSKEITQYLNKLFGKFKFWNREKKKIANSIVHNSTKLMARPLLLSYIHLLVDDERQFDTAFQIYETLIEKWLEREANKRKHGKVEKDVFKNNLYRFSQLIAPVIYEKFIQKKELSILKEQAVEIEQNNKLDLTEYEITGQSLLTRDANHNWKFAHKSILEFFWVKHAIENPDFYAKMAKTDFQGMDMAKAFCMQVLGDWDWVFVKGGTFNRKTKDGKQNVMISSYLIGKYPVTQKLWQEIMDNNPSHFKDENNPVEQVRWYDAIEFCNQLSIKQGLQPYYNILKKGLVETNQNAKGFRLPTEAEWEFAARGGVKTRHALSQFKYAGSNNINEVAWYHGNSKNKPHPVGQKKANELDIYDMSGNVWEWCWDWYGEYGKGDLGNPRGPEIGPARVLRGGSWVLSADHCAVSYRIDFEADRRNRLIGLRLALSL